MKKLNLKKIKKTSRELSNISERQTNFFLQCLAKNLSANKKRIIKANYIDVEKAVKNSLSSSFVERLKLEKIDIEKIITRLEEIARLQAGIGEVIKKRVLKDDLILKKVRVSLGTILIIYEARPEVTIDVSCLCLKSGNTVILKGGSEALNTNIELVKCISQALDKANLPKEAINFIASSDRRITNNLFCKNQYIDLVIARGSYKLVNNVIKKSSIPVLAHSAGGARIYIDKSANIKIINQIIINAKTSKPSACNSLDTILIHKGIANKIALSLINALKANKVKCVGDSYFSKLKGVEKAKEKDWNTEFLSLKVGLKVVSNIHEAIEFINRYGKQHSEAIIATNQKMINYFNNMVDAAAIFCNCSTRLHDGYEFGLGAEMGIASGKLHARGPVGLKELTTYKWIVDGKGQIRQ